MADRRFGLFPALTLALTLVWGTAQAQDTPPPTPSPSPSPTAEETPPQPATPALPLGQVFKAKASKDKPAVFGLKADTAGMLSVFVRGGVQTDLKLIVADGDGQPLRRGISDRQIDGEFGSEQVQVALTAAGAYQVFVLLKKGEESEFTIGAAWVAAPALAKEPDPDGKPSAAKELAANSNSTDTITSVEGDQVDWYKVTVDKNGTLNVVTKAGEGDLVLEAYEEGSYLEPTASSDQDLNEVRGNEALTVLVKAGKTYYFRVLTLKPRAPKIDYKITAGFIPD